MLLHVNKETKRIEGYTEKCISKPIVAEGNELIEVDEIPNEWQFYKYINGEFVLDEEYKKTQIEETELLEIRLQRELECFPIINRGSLWYSMLTDEQVAELDTWYQAWLDAPSTKEIPTKPEWLK